MDEQFKRRLVGAAVLASLAIIFIPMLFEDDSKLEPPPLYQTRIPEKPRAPFESRLLKDEVPAVQPIEREQPVQVDVADETPARDPEPEQTAGLQAWTVQVGSFSSQTNASQLVGKLKSAGFESFLQQAEVEGKPVYRVLVGPEADRVRAEALLPQINAAAGLKGSVKRYP